MPRHNIDPFAQDDEDNVDREVDTFKKELEKEEGKGGGEEALERLNPPEDYPEGQELSVDAEEPTKTRDEKRADRSGLEAAFQGQRDENERLQRRMEDMERRFSQPAEPGPSVDEDDPADSQVEALQQQQADIHALWQKGYKDMSESERATMQKRARKVDGALKEIEFDQMARRRGLAPARTPQQEKNAQLANRLHSENADLYDDVHAHQILLGNFAKARRNGEVESMALHDRVAEETRAELNMPLRGVRPAPTEGQKARLSGRSRGGGTKGSKGSIAMRKEYYAMADAALGHIKDPAKRYRAWAQTAGRSLKENDEA
ncbi:MAG: hypothetical protein V3W41_13005 [Planctomycetota bacterium]